jgi:hypothetical protein
MRRFSLSGTDRVGKKGRNVQGQFVFERGSIVHFKGHGNEADFLRLLPDSASRGVAMVSHGVAIRIFL